MFRSKTGAFTLVETIVVIAIISILAALLTLGISRAMRSSKVGACQSNLSQLYKALSMYQSDNNGYDPISSIYAQSMTGRGDTSKEFKLVMRPYGMVDKQFYCPLDTDARKPIRGEWITHEDTSYFVSLQVFFNVDPSVKKDSPFWIEKIERPSEFLYYMDQTKLVETPEERKRLSNHGARINVLYADGHVREIPTFQP